MKTTDIDSVTELLRTMAEAELAVAKLYRACADIFVAGRDFWLAMERQEVGHAKNLASMNRIVRKKSDRFERGRQFNITALKTFIAGIEQNTRDVRNGIMNEKKANVIARSIEESLIENKISEIMKTDDIEFLTLAREIEDQTHSHLEYIRKKIESAIH